MATKVFLLSPSLSLENVVEGVGGVIQSSFLVSLTINTATNTVTNDSGGSRGIQKAEVVQIIRTLEQFIEKDPNSDFG